VNAAAGHQVVDRAGQQKGEDDSENGDWAQVVKVSAFDRWRDEASVETSASTVCAFPAFF
jgi:hypothetical protein